jgi:hypothetical protein
MFAGVHPRLPLQGLDALHSGNLFHLTAGIHRENPIFKCPLKEH